jgi:primosomal protein N' (replication factor Y)
MPYAEVVVDARTTVPGDRFTYSIPPHLEVEPGHLVRVPFGQRSTHGVVVALTNELRVDYVKPIEGLLHPVSLVDATHLDLAAWMADYYMAAPFDAIASMLPPGLRGRTRQSIVLKPDTPESTSLAPGAQRLLSYLRGNPRPHQIATLTRTLGPWVPNAARALVHAGVADERVIEPELRPAHRTTQVVEAAMAPAALRELAASLTRAPKQAALALRLAEPGPRPILASVARREFGSGALSALVRRGSVMLVETAMDAAMAGAGSTQGSLLPTPPQLDALARINAAQNDPSIEPRTFLLQGVTGSGKTEVYLQALAHCLALGKRAIVLVPELSLTPQAVARFEARFPGQVGLLHSAMSPTKHWGEWWASHEGRRGVVIGPRSALFAPQPGLGLIVLDEEHEWTYKQVDASPRYHARETARELARLSGAVVVLGSATPGVVTAYQAERGTYTMLALPNRIERSGAPTTMADVQIVDMREELRAGNRSVFSRALQAGLQRVLDDKKQAILFLNRRGSAGIVECRSCGHVMRCYRCGTPYTMHGSAEAGSLVCHHCNRRRGVPATCPNCRSPRIRSLGLGTQRLVTEVQELAPEARVLRWDSDSASTPAAHAELLERFESGGADVLVGTQMIAKGLDIPAVTLVGVVLADLGLHLPDFRAPERTFQLLTQVAGRAGRGASAGNVIIQSYAPEHYAVQAAAQQDYDAFYAQEMVYRRAHGNPPVSKLVRLLFGHGQERQARAEAQRMASELRRAARDWDMRDTDVVGPAPSYPSRVRGAWRWHLFLRGPEPRTLLDKIKLPPDWVVDVDPTNVV